MANSKKYWKGFDDLIDSPISKSLAENEFAEPLPSTDFYGDEKKLESSSTSRRDFLKFLGFSTAAATLAACEAPVVESIPYVVKPEEIIPGVPNYYATSIFQGGDFASVLVKTREGRPIKIEPNKDVAFNGGTSARIQGSILSLYDANRLQEPMAGGDISSWPEVIKATKAAIEKANNSGKQVLFVTQNIISPLANKLVGQMAMQYSNLHHIIFDGTSFSGKLDFYEKAIGKRALPTMNLDNASLIVSFNADFLGEYTGQSVSSTYAAKRKPGKSMLRHVQFESMLSISGAAADNRYKLRASEQAVALAYLYSKLGGAVSKPNVNESTASQLDAVAKELKAAAGTSLVLAGGNDEASEAFAFGINQLLGNVGKTLDVANLLLLHAENDAKLSNATKSLASGKVGAVVFVDVNAVHALPKSLGFTANLDKADAVITLTDRLDETAAVANYALPLTHFLESWNILHPTSNTVGLSQPTIGKLFNTMQFEEVLLAWLGEDKKLYDAVKETYSELNLDAPFNTALHDGVVSKEVAAAAALADVDYSGYAKAASAAVSSGTEIVFYRSTALGNGTYANNPWLLEMPDPISRVSWDNYLMVSPSKAEELGVRNYTESNGAVNGDYVTVTVGENQLENVPVFVQPGLAPDTVALAIGYGRTAAGKAGNEVGVNAATIMNGLQHWATGVSIAKASGKHEFACIQLAHTMMGRKIVNETTLEAFLNDSHESWNVKTKFETHKGQLTASETTLWQAHDHQTGHMWNMSIDLNSCIGCGACVIACNAENNVPVVGKDEMRRHRDMHWLRIDRYYSSDMTEEVAEEEGIRATTKFLKMEIASDNPEVVFQPVMCQHCNNAPCETVCPVAATVHSAEGLNHMAYNRCIGTRYCANNCPYKVRRFNWFSYENNSDFTAVNPAQDDLGRMVLNPDVTVRARGVMEKCSLCIQRIQYAKLEAKKDGRKVRDGEFTTACAQACDSGALVFGDINDSASRVAELKKDTRMYHLLEDVGTEPSIFYQTKVRNKA
ncbi:MAG: TAT-variant-translocated molybdopterin oxidoreductase [Schleiferiaceae bacterium]|nr:TAT-variant-translocated molybdopterin oxidoreductase [Schleiferiaceae bacterium]